MSVDTGATLRISRVLLTGPPGIGKTTICKQLTKMIEEKSYKLDGFYTEEVQGPNGRRIGFDVVLVNNSEKKSILARAENAINEWQRSKYKVGNYHVFLNDFETMALPVFDSNADILIIDEIGKMELFSPKFHDKILKLFSETSNKPFIIATIPLMHKIPQRHLPLFQNLHADEKSKVITVNRQNRDTLPQEICHLIS
ncbi:nucleoside-triphosphatase THEP1 [Hylaeus volcanicus]|uniref:nucleoside-triphosphatase THEP1 n=1 Tax=Hylaeus volcanicus TaxID=313075 RepID=UPI0023B7D494|nr:nucleoside-triphosphatase THEP1 [Hylaeus volcanicus]XP_053994571.1 nucleoside-triphosphatase THEP1 [Hylaeus volcanicus]